MRFLSKSEVAEVLRVSVRTVSDYRLKGLLPPARQLGRRLLWNEEELLRYLDGPATRSVLSTAQPAAIKRGRPRKLRV